LGVTYWADGVVSSADGRVAPTIKVVGRFHGKRIRKARWHLRMSLLELASLTSLSTSTLKAMEAASNLQAHSTLGFYRVVGILQLRGMFFSRCRHGGRIGDRCLVPRPKLGPTEEQELARLHRRIGREMRILEANIRMAEDRQAAERGVPLSMRGRVERSPRGQTSSKTDRAMEEEVAMLVWELEEAEACASSTPSGIADARRRLASAEHRYDRRMETAGR
jgi:hypothetical protein